MKPIRIEITNFGAIAHTIIDLSNVTLAAICGPNGAGKSTAFTVAPMFALFGTTKAGTSADDMVRCGSTESEVIYDFSHQGDVWRVIRSRSTKGRGKSTLELQRLSGDIWASESGASIAETQKKIIDLLNLDADTFAASSMILQGDAGNFTKRPAGQRKAILAQILQLDQYETLQEKARAKASETNIALERIKVQMSVINERLAGRDSLEGDKLVAEAQQLTLNNNIRKSEEALQEAQVELAGLQARINQADELGQRVSTLRQELTAKKTEREQQQERRDDAQLILNQESAILAAVDEFEGLRDEITALKVKKDQQNSIFVEASRLKNELTQLNSSLEKVSNEIAELRNTLAERDSLLANRKEYESTLILLEEAEKNRKDHDELQVQLQKAETDLTTAEIRRETEMASRQKEINALVARAAMLKDAKCIDIERANCMFLTDAKEAKSKAQRLQTELDTWYQQEVATAEQMKSRVSNIRTLIDGVGYNSNSHAALQQKAAKLRPDAEAAGKLDGMAQLLTNLETQQTELTNRQTDSQTRLESMRNQYRVLSDGLKDLPEKEKRIAELRPLVAMKEQLPAAKEAFKSATNNIGKLATELGTLIGQITTLEQEYTTLLGDVATLHQQAQNKVNDMRMKVDTYRTEQTSLTAKLGGIQAKLDALAEDAVQYEVLLVELAPLAKKMARWQTLTKAFGRDGIQALILENAVPELERIANDILGQMSGGKNYLRFETQKELKSRSGMAETLDIIVGDWAGERIYETYSGGEQLRIDFAIRFALAEMLARRAGARVDWLTIDEGFGSQSDDFLPMVIEAVQNVANRFGMVLVISHVKAVQEAFGERIEFRPATEEIPSTEMMVA
ncbi:MAG: family ATPase [Firmicutes bacterium]|nr:family ATPase [Bacillota bacterium]